MNINSINVGLTGENLLSIYNDFVSIKEIDIKKVEINDDIKIIGSFSKGVIIKFEVKVKFNSMENGLTKGEVTGVKILNVGIPSFVRKVALKFILKSLKDKGIHYEKGKVIIQYKYLLKDIPYVDFDIYSIYCTYGVLNLELRNAKISLSGELKKEVELLSFENEQEQEYNEEELIKINDFYAKGREKIKGKMPIGVKKYSDYIFVLPDIATLIYRLLKDKRVSMKTKIIISGTVAYITVPCDIIPDKIPFIGKVDDIAIGIFALNIIMTEVPLNVILENSKDVSHGDYSTNICKESLEIGEDTFIKEMIDIPAMKEICVEMLKNLWDALKNDDAELAFNIAQKDNEIDELYEKVRKDCLQVMHSNPTENINQGVRLVFIGRYLERIGDHITNICEKIIYAKNGEMIEIG